MSTGLCPTFLLIHFSWPVPSHSHQRVASSPPALRQAHCGGCTRTVHRPILLLKRQGSQNKHKIAVRKIQGLKYSSYEGDKTKKLQIRWVPDLYFVQTLCERKLWEKSKTSFMLGVESVWSPCLCHWYRLIHPLAAFSYLLNLDSVCQHQRQKLLSVNKIQDKIC